MSKTYGSAVLTALQAQYKSIEDIEQLFYDRKLEAYMQGRSPDKWTDDFWQQIAILEANRCQ